MKVFVTGGTGLVGRHVIAALLARGDRVTALARSDTAAAGVAGMGAVPVRGDITDAPAIEAGVRGADAVVHAAAVVLSRRGWEHYHRTNVAATETVARAAATHGARLVHLSSVAVYGRKTTYDGGERSVDESFGTDRPIFPGDHYARSKREAEQAVWRMAHEEEPRLSAVALRPCVIYGEGDRQFSIRVARALRRGVGMVIGDGSNPLSVVYAGNVAAAALAALDRPDVQGPFNIANDGAVTQREFLERFAGGLGVQLRVLAVPRFLAWPAASAADIVLRAARPGSPMMLFKAAVQFLGHANPFVSSRAERELEWRPVVPPAEAVERTGRWFRDAA
ncbi:MAG: NAD-dependent epimerase/dehydratase family protein [Gemmatimonadales bacterium]|nr:NAD-dependent epimerase/dehydratase family protein [Gemmatimonadales bacterium]